MAHEIFFDTDTLPSLQDACFLQIAKPFLHVNRIFPLHDMVYLVNGRMQIIEDNTEYILTPGSLIFLKAGVHHWGTEFCSPHTSWYYAHFSLPQNRKYPIFGTNDMLSKDFLYTIALPKFIKDATTLGLDKKLQEVVEALHGSSPLSHNFANAGFYEFLLQCSTASQSLSHKDVQYSMIIKVMEYLENNLYAPLNTSALAVTMQLSYKYIGTLFKSHTGRTILEYHTLLRMNKAARLLQETHLTATEISEQLGFNDPFYFSNVFKKIYHFSPREYRKNLPLNS